MDKVFKQGEFQAYSNLDLNEARSYIKEYYLYGKKPVTVFISHKHEDLDDLKGVLGFLEKEYGVKVYIDSRDYTMPKTTSAQTATNIKSRISQCNKFILLATNGAIESKWCNWELGYGDAKKFKNNIALFPMRPTFSSSYKGNEYLLIYPYIKFSDGTERLTNGQAIHRGYYVVTYEDCYFKYISLKDWFDQL